MSQKPEFTEQSLYDALEQYIPGFQGYVQGRVGRKEDLLWRENQALNQLVYLIPVSPGAALQIALLLGKWTVLQ